MPTVLIPGCHVACLDGLRSKGQRFFSSSMCQARRNHLRASHCQPSQCHAGGFCFSIEPFAVVAVALTRALPVLAGSLFLVPGCLVFLMFFGGVLVASRVCPDETCTMCVYVCGTRLVLVVRLLVIGLTELYQGRYATIDDGTGCVLSR
jgi:hypothetical protein